jgi:hypothetical protein
VILGPQARPLNVKACYLIASRSSAPRFVVVRYIWRIAVYVLFTKVEKFLVIQRATTLQISWFKIFVCDFEMKVAFTIFCLCKGAKLSQ